MLLLLSGGPEPSLPSSTSTVHAWTSWTHTCTRLRIRAQITRTDGPSTTGSSKQPMSSRGGKDVSMTTQANEEAEHNYNRENPRLPQKRLLGSGLGLTPDLDPDPDQT